MADLVNVLIDGKAIAVEKGTLVIEAARRAGVMIPNFCHHPKLKPDANCRMCLVEIEKVPKLQTSCSTLVAEGMAVRTNTPEVNNAHKTVLEFILANHPLDCPICDQGGRCDLQDFSHQYTPTTSDFIDVKRVFQKEYFSPLIEKEMNRCVQCLRCVRYCDEVVDAKALAPINRGTMTEISHFTSHQLECEYCGGCVQICPVGAFTSRLSGYEFRPWMLKRADTTCGYCGDGCSLTLQSRGHQIIEVMSAYGEGRNNGDLCARGFFGYQFVNHPDRLTTPLVREADGSLRPVSWEEALPLVVQGLTQTKLAGGAGVIAGLIGARCTNEDLYVFQKFMRLAVGSPHLDSSVRYGFSNAVNALRRVQGTNRWTVTYEDILKADVLLLIGTQITFANPIVGFKVKEAVKRHAATLLTIETGLPSVETISNIVNLASVHLPVAFGRHGEAIRALIKALFEANLIDPACESKAPSFVAQTRAAAAAQPYPDGIDRGALTTIAKSLAAAKRGVIVIGQDLLQAPGGYDATVNLFDLLLLMGKLTQPGWGLAPLTEENNEQGAIEMGATAEYLPGPDNWDDEPARARMATVWSETLPAGRGMRLPEIIEAAGTGKLKALYIVGENPVGTLPAGAGASEALKKLDFLVVQELFLTETARLAHIVLPACSYAEKNGTFTNSEGFVQKVRRALEAIGDSRPDWEILSAVSVLMGYPLEYEDPGEILKEIRAVIPEYTILGSAPEPARVDTGVMERYLAGGFAEDLTSRYRACESKGVSASWAMMVGPVLFHSGKLSTRAKGLMEIQSDGRLLMNPTDAQRLGIASGDWVKLAAAAGEAEVPVTILGRIPEGMLYFPESFRTPLAHVLSLTVDRMTGVPYTKLQQVTIRKLPVTATSVSES
jgi:formate dehydrogenase (NADP+) alpha subunit